MNDCTQLLPRFDRLMRDVESGTLSQNCFQPWEVELLLDMQACELGADRKRVLRRYQRAVHRAFERGASRPLKLSEYLKRLRKLPRESAA